MSEVGTALEKPTKLIEKFVGVVEAIAKVILEDIPNMEKQIESLEEEVNAIEDKGKGEIE